MKQIVLLMLTGLAIGQIETRAQGLGDVLRAPDKALPVVNQTLDGTWLYELRRGGQPANQPPVLLLFNFIRTVRSLQPQAMNTELPFWNVAKGGRSQVSDHHLPVRVQ